MDRLIEFRDHTGIDFIVATIPSLATRTTIGQRQITVTCRHCNNHFTKLE